MCTVLLLVALAVATVDPLPSGLAVITIPTGRGLVFGWSFMHGDYRAGLIQKTEERGADSAWLETNA